MRNLPWFLLFTVFILNNVNAQNKKFVLESTITNNYSGYIFLEYENRKDSCLIINNHFSFSGTLKNQITAATFYLKNKSTNSPDLYLEPGKMFIKMSIEDKNFKDNSKVTFMNIISAEGSKTTQKAIEYSAYLKEHSADKDLQQKLYKKVGEIVVQNPKSPLGCSLICGLSRPENIDKKQLTMIYDQLDKKNQNPMLIGIINRNLQ